MTSGLRNSIRARWQHLQIQRRDVAARGRVHVAEVHLDDAKLAVCSTKKRRGQYEGHHRKPKIGF